MATQSANLDLRLPTNADGVTVESDISENMTKIDAAFAALPAGGGGARAPFFSYSGALNEGASGRWYPAGPAFGVHVFRVVASLGTAGTDDTIIDLLWNGDPVATLTIPSGDFVSGLTVDQGYIAETDYLQLEITTAGADAADLLVELVVEPMVDL